MIIITDPLKDICGLNHKYTATCGRVTFVAHNHKFDAKFLDSEFINEGQPAFQSITNAMDTIIVAHGLFSKEYIQEFKETKRKELEEKRLKSKFNEPRYVNTQNKIQQQALTEKIKEEN